MSLTAFLLCAGYGQRLRPLTERVAKPAIPFLGESAFEIVARQIDALKPDRRIANAHHLPDQIRALAEPRGVEVLFEPEILGTGGCVGNAAGILGRTDHFLVHNADLIHGIDLEALYEEHLRSGADATLAGIRHPEINTLSVGADGELLGVHGFRTFENAPEAARLTFSGIAFYRRGFLAFAGTAVEDAKPLWARAREAGASIRVADRSGSPWHDFGTPQGLWEATQHRMELSGNFNHRYPAGDAHARVSNEAGVENLPPGLESVVILEDPGRAIAPGTKNRIVGRGFEWIVA